MKTNCIPADELQLFLLEQLPSAQTEVIIEHLEHCLRCQQTLESLSDDKTLRSFLESLHSIANFSAGEGSTASLSPKPVSLTKAKFPPGTLFNDRCLPQRFGRFELRLRLGRGGFGTVYLAFDTDLEREVALKIPHLERLSPGSRLRFIREGRAAACLHHPNIVSVFEAGIHDQVSYIVSDYVPGPTLQDYLRNPPVNREPVMAAQIVLQLAEAVKHAHECQIIHCDIKPSNILLDNRFPNDHLAFRPLLTDFGIARYHDQSRPLNVDDLATDRLIAGSLPYMSPEQLRGEIAGPASDIYAIGAVLFELLAGRPPYRAPEQNDHHIEISTSAKVLSKRVPLDLIAICVKCLAADPAQRYESAALLAEDINAFLHHAPTIARPLNPVDRAIRWSRRNPLALTLMIAPLLLLTVLASGLLWHNESLRLINQRLSEANSLVKLHSSQAEQSEARVRLLLYSADMRLAELAWRKGDLKAAKEILARYDSPIDSQEDLRGIEWYFLKSSVFAGSSPLAKHSDWLHSLAIHPAKPIFATGGSTSTIYLHNLANGKLLKQWETGQLEINSLAFSTKGDVIASAGDDGSIKFWNGEQLLQHLQAHEGKAYGIAFIPNSDLIISCGTDGFVKLWQLDSQMPIDEWQDHDGAVEAITVSLSGQQIASVGRDGKCVVRNLKRRELTFSFQASGALSDVAFSPDETSLAIVSSNSLHRMLNVFDLNKGKSLGQHVAPDGLTRVGFSADGKKLFTADRAGTLKYWSWNKSNPNRALETQPNWERSLVNSRITATAFSSQTNSLLCTTKAGQILATQLTSHNLPLVVSVESLAETLSPDKRETTIYECVTTRDSDSCYVTFESTLGLLTVDDSLSLAPIANFDGGPDNQMAVTEQGERIAIGAVTRTQPDAQDSYSAKVRILDLTRGEQSIVWQSSTVVDIADLAITNNGRFVALVIQEVADKGVNKRMLLMDTQSNAVVYTQSASSSSQVCFTPNGEWLFLNRQQEIVAVQIGSDRSMVLRDAHLNAQHLMTIDRSGNWLATADLEREIKLWRLPQMELHASLVGHVKYISDMKFSADGRTLISCGLDGTIKAWNVPAGRFVMDLYNDPQVGFSKIEFTPSNERLFYIRSDNTIGTIRMMQSENKRRGLSAKN